MAIITLRPLGLITAGGWTVSSGPFVTAISDNSDVTYVEKLQFSSIPPSAFAVGFTVFPDVQNSPGMKVRSVTPRTRGRMAPGSPAPRYTYSYLYFTDFSTPASFYLLPATFSTVAGSSYTTDPLNAEWTIANVNQTKILYDTYPYQDICIFRVAELYLDISTNDRPIVTPTNLDGSPVFLTSTPTFKWIAEDDGDGQAKYRIKVFSGLGSVANPETELTRLEFDSGEITSSAIQFVMPSSLSSAGHVVAIKTADGGTQGRFGGGNLLSYNDSSFETSVGTWVGANCTVARVTTQAQEGLASLQMTSTAGGVMFASGVTSPVNGNERVEGRLYIKSNATSRLAAAQIDFFTSGMVSISSTVGPLVATSTTSWTRYVVAGSSPANAAFARVVPIVFSTAVAEVHFVDWIHFAVAGPDNVSYAQRPFTLSYSPPPVPTVVTTEQPERSRVCFAITEQGSPETTEFIVQKTALTGPELYDQNERGFDYDLGGWVVDSNATISRDEVPSAKLSAYSLAPLQGAAVLKIKTTAAGNAVIRQSRRAAVVSTPTLKHALRLSLHPSSTVRSFRGEIRYWTGVVGGAQVGTPTIATFTEGAGQWTQAMVTDPVPTTAKAVEIRVHVLAGAAGEVHYLDAISFTEVDFVEIRESPFSLTNLLTSNEESIETDATGWAANLNVTAGFPQRSTAFALKGTASLLVSSSVAGGTMRVRTVRRIPVTAGVSYRARAWAIPAATARTFAVFVNYYDATGALVGTSSTAATLEVLGQFVEDTDGGFIAPATAVEADVNVEWNSVVMGELHYVDFIQLRPTSLTVCDRDAARNCPNAYRVAASQSTGTGTSNVSAFTTPTFNDLTDDDQVWLVTQGNPELDMPVHHIDQELSSDREEDVVFYAAEGRTDWLPFGGTIRDEVKTMTFFFLTDSDYRNFLKIRALQNSVLIKSCYGDNCHNQEWVRLGAILNTTTLTTQDMNDRQFRRVTIEVRVVREP